MEDTKSQLILHEHVLSIWYHLSHTIALRLPLLTMSLCYVRTPWNCLEPITDTALPTWHVQHTKMLQVYKEQISTQDLHRAKTI